MVPTLNLAIALAPLHSTHNPFSKTSVDTVLFVVVFFHICQFSTPNEIFILRYIFYLNLIYVWKLCQCIIKLRLRCRKPLRWHIIRESPSLIVYTWILVTCVTIHAKAHKYLCIFKINSKGVIYIHTFILHPDISLVVLNSVVVELTTDAPFDKVHTTSNIAISCWLSGTGSTKLTALY